MQVARTGDSPAASCCPSGNTGLWKVLGTFRRMYWGVSASVSSLENSAWRSCRRLRTWFLVMLSSRPPWYLAAMAGIAGIANSPFGKGGQKFLWCLWVGFCSEPGLVDDPGRVLVHTHACVHPSVCFCIYVRGLSAHAGEENDLSAFAAFSPSGWCCW